MKILNTDSLSLDDLADTSYDEPGIDDICERCQGVAHIYRVCHHSGGTTTRTCKTCSGSGFILLSKRAKGEVLEMTELTESELKKIVDTHDKIFKIENSGYSDYPYRCS